MWPESCPRRFIWEWPTVTAPCHSTLQLQSPHNRHFIKLSIFLTPDHSYGSIVARWEDFKGSPTCTRSGSHPKAQTRPDARPATNVSSWVPDWNVADFCLNWSLIVVSANKLFCTEARTLTHSSVRVKLWELDVWYWLIGVTHLVYLSTSTIEFSWSMLLLVKWICLFPPSYFDCVWWNTANLVVAVALVNIAASASPPHFHCKPARGLIKRPGHGRALFTGEDNSGPRSDLHWRVLGPHGTTGLRSPFPSGDSLCRPMWFHARSFVSTQQPFCWKLLSRSCTSGRRPHLAGHLNNKDKRAMRDKNCFIYL